MVKQGITWYNLETEIETVLADMYFFYSRIRYGMPTSARMQLLAWVL